jgi:hypothetical protein
LGYPQELARADNHRFGCSTARFEMLTNYLNTSPSFLRLEDLLLPPPLPAIVSVLMVLGILNLSVRVGGWLKFESKSALDRAAVFVIATGLLGAIVHAVAWSGHASIPTLRFGAWLLAALGIVQLGKLKPRTLARTVAEYWRYSSRLERYALTVSIVALTGLFAAAVGPAVDADSLEQHLAVPLDWLRHGGAYPRPDWLTARYVGLGESLNMLGLAAGTDGFGAALQAAGLVVALIAVMAFAKSREDRLFAVVLVVACPVIVPLITNQKPQLLPVAALTVALVIVVRNFKTFDLATAILTFGCAAFAMASKHSFLLTGSMVVLMGLIAAVRSERLAWAAAVFVCCFVVLAAPVFIRNLVFYGDPVSPLLERWRPGGDPALVEFAERYLREYGGAMTLRKLARLPLDLVVTPKLGLAHEALGLGTFAFLLAVREGGSARKLLLAAVGAFLLVVAVGQPTPRFFLESYLWCAAAIVLVPVHRLKTLFFRVLTVQATLVALAAMYLGGLLFPGALTQTQRERVMSLMAPGYTGAKWLDATLPSNAVILEDYRYRALLPRPFVVADRFVLTSESNWKQDLATLVKDKHVTALVTRYPIESPPLSWLATQYGSPLAGPEKFRDAARSPLNRGNVSEWIAIRINLNRPPN